MRAFQGPNVICLSRANSPPLIGCSLAETQEKTPDVEASEVLGSKAELCGLSDKSSLNLSRLLSSLDWEYHGQCWHVTLTYHNDFPRTKDDLAKAKSHISALLGRHFECGLWRLEFQERLAPHWHCLLWIGNRNPAELETWLRGWWADYSGNPSVHGVFITPGHEGRHTWYLVKHAAKDGQAPAFKVGRWWGFINRAKLLEAQEVEEVGQLSPDELKQWARLARRHRRANARHGREAARSWRMFCRAFGFYLPRAFRGDLVGWGKVCESQGRFVGVAAVKPYRRGEQGLSWFLPRRVQWEVFRWVREELARRAVERRRGVDPF